MRERRLEKRFWCADLVTVEWGDGQNEARTTEAVLEDISPIGACIQVEEPIPAGVAVSISARCGESGCKSGCPGPGPNGRAPKKEARFSGRVSHCEYRDYGYFVGIRFSDETKWSSGLFEPQHLTNPAALADS